MLSAQVYIVNRNINYAINILLFIYDSQHL